MDKVKVSVIMPVYNTAAYLRQALDSICNQTLRELQIIVVDDGSTDPSPEIIREYASSDPRILALRQVNQGQGAARNHGLQKVKGEFIYFMDSDDLLDTDCLQVCYDLAIKEQLDYVTFDAKALVEHQQQVHGFDYDRSEAIDAQRVWDSRELLLHTLLNDSYRSSVCLFLMRTSVVQSHAIRFPEGIIHEDNAFVLQWMLSAQKARYLPRFFFHRRVRESSTMTQRFTMRNVQGYVTVAIGTRKWMEQHPEWRAFIHLYLHKTLNSVAWLAHRLTIGEKWKMTRLFCKHRLWQYVSWKNRLVFLLK